MLTKLFPNRAPSDITAAKAELAEAKLSHLKARSDAEYAAASVLKHNAMAEFHQGRVARLSEYLSQNEAKNPVEWDGVN